ncbi:MAG: hypothetical protein HKM98_05870, partial [Gammaproteobacteria bacterium]|nr:hypothetical protein [Gammaproteobacteria bacterium]
MSRILLIAIFLSGCASQAPVVTPGGKLIFAAGTVTAQRGNLVSLQPDDLVYEQNLVVTDKRSRAQFLMNDGTMLALRPQTRLYVEAYANTTQQGYVLDLLQGGMRSISRGMSYNRIKTPAGTIGISNAHYNLVWCNDSCSMDNDNTVMNGLYLGISEGAARITNNSG